MIKKILLICIALISLLTSCKKEEEVCEICPTCPTNELESIDGTWVLVEYRKEEMNSWKITISNDINNNLHIDDDRNFEIESFYNNIYTEANIDSTYNYTRFKYFNESTSTFNDSIKEETVAYVTKTSFNYSYEISINNQMWETNLTQNKNFYIKYQIAFNEFGDTTFYWVEEGGDSLVNPNDSITQKGELFWDGYRINAGLMSGKVKSISKTEIIIEDIITYENSKREEPFLDSLYTYSDTNNPEIKEEGIQNIIYDDLDTYKVYSKWIAK